MSTTPFIKHEKVNLVSAPNKRGQNVSCVFDSGNPTNLKHTIIMEDIGSDNAGNSYVSLDAASFYAEMKLNIPINVPEEVANAASTKYTSTSIVINKATFLSRASYKYGSVGINNEYIKYQGFARFLESIQRVLTKFSGWAAENSIK